MLRNACGLIVVVALAIQCRAAHGARPSETLLPQTTKAYLSVPSVDGLREQWEQTQFGQLARDPVMKPFVDDLRHQIRDKLGQTATRLALTWEDIDSVHSGEVCVAMIQPDADQSKHATALLVDVTDRSDATTTLLSKLDSAVKERGGTNETRNISGTEVRVYSIPSKKDATKRSTVFVFVKQDQLVAVDNEGEATAILARFGANPADSLASVPAFQETMKRSAESSEGLAPSVRWFVEPIGYGHVVRAAAGGFKRRGKDRLLVLAEQGFDAIQGLGGHVNLATDQHEILHRTFIFAPAVQRSDDEQNQDRYNQAFRMFNFPNTSHLPAQDWIPRDLASYVTLRWKMKDAFEYSKTLVDAIAGDTGFFEDFLASLRDDPNGPQIDIRKELVAHLGERATIVSDNVVPVTPESERLMLGLELTNAGAVAQSLDRALETDPYARRLEIDGHTVWEMISEEEEETPAVVIDGIGLTPIPGLDFASEPEPEEKRMLANSAIAVAHGQLLVTSHLDLMKRIITQDNSGETLSDSLDYAIVNHALDELGADENSFRCFSRMDEEYRTTYELVRQNRMPESKSLAGRVLNRLFGPDEDGILRQQYIDGEKLPDYQVVRRYLGPAGIFIRSLEDGWMVTGVVLTKEEPFDPEVEQPAITTASVQPDRE